MKIIEAYKTIIFLLIMLLGVSVRGQSDENSGTIVKVLSFNILHGANTNGEFDLDVIARVIEDADPDLVALQEVDYKTNRAQQYDLVTELGWRTKLLPLFGRAMYYDDGEYGEGILSRYTIWQSRNWALPHQDQHEPRAALEMITVLPSGDTIAFVGTHLDHTKDESDRISQAKRINEIFSNSPYPTILAGDLNDIPGSSCINIFEEFWTSSYNDKDPAPTYPSTIAVKKIDYVMYSPDDRWEVIKSEVICDSIASDHCAYLVWLKLLPEDIRQ
jgi:endonuclease/exonuclease/phosphatase family metal-dependent hydrolase